MFHHQFFFFSSSFLTSSRTIRFVSYTRFCDSRSRRKIEPARFQVVFRRARFGVLAFLPSLLMMRICRDDANTLFTRRFYPNPTTCASSRNRLSLSWNPNFPKMLLISSTENSSTFRFKSFTFAPSSSRNSRYTGLLFCHSTETFSPNRKRFSTSCFRSFFNSGWEFKRHPGQEMNFAETTRESSSSDGWKCNDAEEDEENAKHAESVEKKSNNERRTKPWKWKKRRLNPRDGVKAIIISF